MAPPTIRVEVWSDIACPWCWVGWSRLQQALDDLQGQATFDVRWRAFLLDPGFPEAGEHIESFYSRRYGPDQAAALRQRLHDGGEAGLAHELIALSGRGRRSHDAAGLLFRCTYEDGANVSERQELLDAACKLGLLRDEGEAWLGSREAAAMVAAEDSEGKHKRGIDAVPTFFIRCGGSKEVQLVGAESVKAFEVAFRKVLHEAGGTPASPPSSPKKAAAAGTGELKTATVAGAQSAVRAAAEE
ncbi:disulfide bond formation [Chlorella sorokiniana]|uniref:Disulfide bond formation n=1 Tax=Chlorella sorokiniana TaxID=3076 RepID=A0A2P6TQF1_CHLSO|nr:disulfide bond formation [Chlorella sorokiniana]|eukprot:PRW56259.1 disulfide bond formation [Chlorella sorokiniana]